MRIASGSSFSEMIDSIDWFRGGRGGGVMGGGWGVPGGVIVLVVSGLRRGVYL